MKDNSQNIQTWNAIGRETTHLCNALRRHMLEFCKKKRKTQRSLLIMNLSRRIECNCFAIISLTKVALQTNGSTYLKLPIGLLLRSCFIDCISGLYISILPLKDVKLYARILREEYVKSCLEMEEVYKDKISDIGLPQSIVEGIYTLQLEDTFLSYLSLDKQWKQCPDQIPWKVELSDKHVTIKQMKVALEFKSSLSSLVRKLYAYYKYFSQYEHFSDFGHGDSLANYGDDNVSFEKAIRTLEEGVGFLLKQVFPKGLIMTNQK